MPPLGRPKEDPRIALTIRITEDTKSRLLAAVREGNPKMNTPGKVVESKFKKPRKKAGEE